MEFISVSYIFVVALATQPRHVKFGILCLCHVDIEKVSDNQIVRYGILNLLVPLPSKHVAFYDPRNQCECSLFQI